MKSLIRLRTLKWNEVFVLVENRHVIDNQHQMYYRIHGNGKEVVIFLHGIPTNSRLWLETISFMNNVTSITTDLLGYGSSSRAPAEYLTLPQQAAYVASLIRALNLNGVHIVGHDLGGGIAQILAVHEPQLVRSIVVIDGVCFSNWPLREVVSLRYPTMPENQNPQLFIEMMIRQGIYLQPLVTSELLGRFIPPFSGPNGLFELQQCSYALEHIQTEAISPLLKDIAIPATFLWGEFDRFLPPYWGWLLQQTVRGSEFRVIREAGHFSMIDQPQTVANELQMHLVRTAGTNLAMSASHNIT